MFPTSYVNSLKVQRFPRASGDVPLNAAAPCLRMPFSPRERGCFDAASILKPKLAVFPARAGMFPPSAAPGDGGTRFPRASGDVPWMQGKPATEQEFSPRERGCSCPRRLTQA